MGWGGADRRGRANKRKYGARIARLDIPTPTIRWIRSRRSTPRELADLEYDCRERGEKLLRELKVDKESTCFLLQYGGKMTVPSKISWGKGCQRWFGEIFSLFCHNFRHSKLRVISQNKTFEGLNSIPFGHLYGGEGFQ